MMIPKEVFISTINHIHDLQKSQQDIDNYNRKNPILSEQRIDILFSVPTIVKTLLPYFYTEDYLRTTGTNTLSYWIDDCNCGETFKIGDIEDSSLPESDPYHKPDLTTPAKLYDYLVYESKTLSTTE